MKEIVEKIIAKAESILKSQFTPEFRTEYANYINDLLTEKIELSNVEVTKTVPTVVKEVVSSVETNKPLPELPKNNNFRTNKETNLKEKVD